MKAVILHGPGEVSVGEFTTPTPKAETDDGGAMSLQDCITEQVVAELAAADLNIMSPLEVMNLVFQLQRRLKNG